MSYASIPYSVHNDPRMRGLSLQDQGLLFVLLTRAETLTLGLSKIWTAGLAQEKGTTAGRIHRGLDRLVEAGWLERWEPGSIALAPNLVDPASSSVVTGWCKLLGELVPCETTRARLADLPTMARRARDRRANPKTREEWNAAITELETAISSLSWWEDATPPEVVEEQPPTQAVEPEQAPLPLDLEETEVSPETPPGVDPLPPSPPGPPPPPPPTPPGGEGGTPQGATDSDSVSDSDSETEEEGRACAPASSSIDQEEDLQRVYRVLAIGLEGANGPGRPLTRSEKQSVGKWCRKAADLGMARRNIEKVLCRYVAQDQPIGGPGLMKNAVFDPTPHEVLRGDTPSDPESRAWLAGQMPEDHPNRRQLVELIGLVGPVGLHELKKTIISWIEEHPTPVGAAAGG